MKWGSFLSLLFIAGLVNIITIVYYHSTLKNDVMASVEKTKKNMVKDSNDGLRNEKSAEVAYVVKDSNDRLTSEKSAEKEENVVEHSNDGLPEEASSGKEEIIRILSNSGLEVTPDLIKDMPPYENFISMYGEKAKVIGLDTCKTFRTNTSPADAIIGPAGHYNTGTNLLFKLLFNHCEIEGREKLYEDTKSIHEGMIIRSPDMSVSKMVKTGMWPDIPWNKHGPLSWRKDEKMRPIGVDYKINQVLPDLKYQDVFPIVMVKDPYSWMESMLQHTYDATWGKSRYSKLNLNYDYDSKRDSNQTTQKKKIRFVTATSRNRKGQIVRRPTAFTSKTPIVRVKFHHQRWVTSRKWRRTVSYDNLVDMWNKFYGDYLNANFPRLIVRYEDLLLHTEEVIPQICECVGGKLVDSENGVHLQAHSGKNPEVFGETSGVIKALKKYGDSKVRTANFSTGDMIYSDENISKDLMDAFQYSFPKFEKDEE